MCFPPQLCIRPTTWLENTEQFKCLYLYFICNLRDFRGKNLLSMYVVMYAVNALQRIS